jgi:glucose-1-phosphate adenylyltransferase
MARQRVLAIIQAGGLGGRMDVLTRERAKPALPFAGVYQLVDFPLSNLTHSGITDVWLSLQFQGSTLEEEVANGRPWDLDRNRGGLRLLMPHEGSGGLDEEGFSRGNADELFRIRDQIADFDPEVVLVMSADHVYHLDYNEVLATHRDRSAECTVVTTRVEREEAGDHSCVHHDDDGVVTDFVDKPEDPQTDVVAAEVFAYEADEGDTGLGDFGDHLLPRLVERGRTVVHSLEGYWRDLGQPHLYLRAHRDVLTDDQGVLARPGWPVLTRQPQRAPARLHEGARVVDSLVSPGCAVEGEVVRSVLGPGVVVEAGARVHDSVVFADCHIEAGAQVCWSVLDIGSVVETDAVVSDPDARGDEGPDEVTLVGRGSRIRRGSTIERGSRLEPGSTA